MSSEMTKQTGQQDWVASFRTYVMVWGIPTAALVIQWGCYRTDFFIQVGEYLLDDYRGEVEDRKDNRPSSRNRASIVAARTHLINGGRGPQSPISSHLRWAVPKLAP